MLSSTHRRPKTPSRRTTHQQHFGRAQRGLSSSQEGEIRNSLQPRWGRTFTTTIRGTQPVEHLGVRSQSPPREQAWRMRHGCREEDGSCECQELINSGHSGRFER
ncbi:unnamed protein product, partial [Discosporangium mesarthrocarpum]